MPENYFHIAFILQFHIFSIAKVASNQKFKQFLKPFSGLLKEHRKPRINGVRSCEHFCFRSLLPSENMWRYYLPCSRFQSDSLTLGWVTCCLRIEIAVVTLWISVASTISASPSSPSFNASLPCSISTAANMSQVWPQTHFGFLCKISLICLQGKSKTPHWREFCSSLVPTSKFPTLESI